MQCVICKNGQTRNDKASLTVEKEGSYLVFSNVPAEVCNNCGEAYFSAITSKTIHQQANEAFKKGKEIELIRLAS